MKFFVKLNNISVSMLHTLFGKIKIYFCPSELQIVDQLRTAVKKSENAALAEKGGEIDMVVHIAGFNLPSWSDSLNLTGRLHEYLDLALTRKAKFVLVLPDRSDDFIKVSMSLVEQFARLFRLSYEIILLDPQLRGEELAKKILEKIFHGHILLASESLEPPAPARAAARTKKTNSFWPKLVWLLFGFIVTTWLIFAGSYAVGLWTLSPTATGLARVASFMTPGAGYLAGQKFIPVDSLHSLATRSHKISNLSSGLLLKLTTSQGLLDLSAHTDDLQALLENLNFQLVDLQSLQTVPGWLTRWKDGQISQTTASRQLVVKINNIAPDLSELLGVTRPKKYALIFQDNTEVRATGGFIQGFALLQVANGEVTDSQYFTSSQTDQLLRGHVDAPPDLNLALGQKNWYLRDANWDPNFINSARRIAWFIDKELGGSPDVVVAVNWQTLAAALNAFGPVDLKDFGGKITSSNWLDKYQQYAKAGSGESANMMMEVAKGIFTKNGPAASAQKTQMAGFILQQLGLRQILIAPITFASPGLGLVDWQGETALPDCRSQHPCQVMQILAVDSNVGLNRVNPYITRDHTLVAQVGADKTDYEYTINYANNSPKPGWPTGDYKNFLRVYLPKGVVVGEGDYTVTIESNFVVVKTMLTVPYQKTAQIKIKFAQGIPNTDKFHAQLDLLNQPGMKPEKLEVAYNYPKIWLASSQKQFTLAAMGQLKYNATVDSPYRLDIDFVKWKNTP